MLCALLFLVFSVSFAGQKAVTDTGELVILNDDGTWTYENTAKSGQDLTKISTNKTQFRKPESSVFQLKSKATNLGLWINPKKWKFAEKGSLSPAAEFELKHDNLDIYGLVITETIEIKLENLADIAFENAQSAGENAKVVTKEYRVVNGTKVIYMETDALVSGIQATYLGYYYSDTKGSNQILVFTGTSMVKKYESEIFDMLNGFVVR